MMTSLKMPSWYKYCGGEKILSPPWFQHCGGERRRRLRRSDVAGLAQVKTSELCSIDKLAQVKAVKRARPHLQGKRQDQGTNG